MDYVIGVDAGGTKTEAIAYSLSGEELGKSICGFGNLLCGKEEGLKNILDSIEGCMKGLDSEGLKKIYVGAAGMEVGNNACLIEESIKKATNKEVQVINDGELALRALLKGEDGILTIAGTGSIVIGVNGTFTYRCGGWGHLLGDEGSGYAVAIKAFKRMIYEKEVALEKSVLSKTILEELGFNSVDNIMEFVYSSTKDRIAKIATTVSRLAEEGESNALYILNTEGEKLAITTERVYKKLNFEGQCRIAIKGSVIEKSKNLRRAFEYYLASNLKDVRLVCEEVSSCKGAYYMWLKRDVV
jgi:N-acetylglucosamine kinase-like BadF-type ATPase